MKTTFKGKLVAERQDFYTLFVFQNLDEPDNSLIGVLFYNRGEKPLLGIIIGIISVGILVGLSISIPQEIANAIGWIVSVLGTILLYLVIIKNAKEK